MGAGHFGGRVIGEKAAKHEAVLVKSGAIHFGPSVIGELPHVAGERVLRPGEKPPKEQQEKLQNVWGMTGTELKAVLPILSEDDVPKLEEWLKAESMNPEHDGGRKSVLRILRGRHAELTGVEGEPDGDEDADESPEG